MNRHNYAPTNNVAEALPKGVLANRFLALETLASTAEREGLMQVASDIDAIGDFLEDQGLVGKLPNPETLVHFLESAVFSEGIVDIQALLNILGELGIPEAALHSLATMVQQRRTRLLERLKQLNSGYDALDETLRAEIRRFLGRFGRVARETHKNRTAAVQQNTHGASKSRFKPHPLLSNAAKFSGIDPHISPLPTENPEAEGNAEKLQNRLQPGLAARNSAVPVLQR